MKLALLNISILKTYNFNTGYKSAMVSNKWHNLQNKIVQFTGQKKAWIGTIAILKGLKYKLSFWTSLKSKSQLIQLTDRQTGTLKCWNVGIELSMCGTTQSPSIYTLTQFLSMLENNCEILLAWLIYQPWQLKKEQAIHGISLPLSAGGQFSLPNFERMSGC